MSKTKPAAAASPAMPFDPLAFVVPEDRSRAEARFDGPPRTWFAVDRDRMYPAVIAAIVAGAKPTDRSQVVDGELAKDADAEKYRLDLARCRKLPKQAFEDALLPELDAERMDNGELVPCKVSPAINMPFSRREARAQVLETARLWFTNELQRAVGGPIGVHLLAPNDRWNL